MTDRERGKPAGLAGGAARRRQRETSADRARVGSVIAGSYRIDEVIGRGAIGAVFGGVHLRLERPVAVKFVDPALVDDPEIRARFKREAKIAAQIGSSHAVEVFDYGVGEDGAPYLVMERLVGEDLHARLQREGRLPVDRALRIAKQVCRALGSAHAHGIVHRDLKPENVFLVDRDGEPEFVKVVDFGLSTFVQSDDTRLTRAGQSVGTPLYMAPEQAGAHQFDARVDVYSLGVLIFEATTGRLPFEATTLQALLVALTTQPPRSIRYYCPDLPVELDDLVLRFIARDPRVRPKSAAAALAEIIALEERLATKAKAAVQRPQARELPAVAEVAIDGLPGKLPGAFAEEITGHLDAMRRTGRLSTSNVDLAAAGGDVGVDPTRPMDRRELDRMATASPRTATPRPAATKPATKAPVDRPSARKLPVGDDAIEEDSGVFYGRVGENGSPMPIELEPSPKKAKTPSARKAPKASRRSATLPPATPRGRSGPPAAVLWIAAAAFLLVAALVGVRLLR